jgi:hypothetical protein
LSILNFLIITLKNYTITLSTKPEIKKIFQLVFKVQIQPDASANLETFDITIEHGTSKLHTAKKSTAALEVLTLGQHTIDESQTDRLQKLTHIDSVKEIGLSCQSTAPDNLQSAQRVTHVLGVSLFLF